MPRILHKDEILRGRWRIIKHQGSGGQALGYLAEDLKATPDKPWLRTAFVKHYHDVYDKDNKPKELLEHYNKIATRLTKDGGLNYLAMPRAIGTDDGCIYVAFEVVAGETLLSHLKQGTRFGSDNRVRAACAIANSVRLIHKSNIAHLDLKPENVMLEWSHKHQNYFTRLIDIDAARIDGHGLRDKLIGTPGYHSPEHTNREYGEVGINADIFTLGIILWQILFDSHPFSGADNYATCIEQGPPDFPESTYHRDILKMIYRALKPNPQDRPSAGQIYYQLNKHRDTRFTTENVNQRWVYPDTRSNKNEQISMALALVGLHCDPPWQRVYRRYPVVLGRNSMRGSGISTIPSRLLEFALIDATSVHVRLLTPWDVKLDKLPLALNVWVTCQPDSILYISKAPIRLQLLAEHGSSQFQGSSWS